MRFIASPCAYKLWTRICSRISMKFNTLVHKIVSDHHIKFHEDPSFCCRDICKTILAFFNHWFSMYFSYSPNYRPSKPSEMDNYLIIIDIFGNFISKCTYLMKKRTPVEDYRLLSIPSNKPIGFVSSRGTTCIWMSAGVYVCLCVCVYISI